MDHPEEEGGLTGADDTLERRQERNCPHWEFSSPPHYCFFFFLQGAPISSHKSGRELNSKFPESGDSPLPTGMTVNHFMPLRRSARAECVFSYAGSERGSLDKSDASGEHTVSKSIHTVQDIILVPLAITQSVR